MSVHSVHSVHALSPVPATPPLATAPTPGSPSGARPAAPPPAALATSTSSSADSVVSRFDLVHDRTGTGSLKWDFAVERGRPASALPLWVADMDHRTAPAVTSALLWRVRHGIFGYTEPDAAYHAALTGWFARRYGWAVDPAWNVITPGVVPALALAVRALTGPGDAVVIEEPVYYPFRQVVEDNGRSVVSVPLTRDADGVYRRDPAALEDALARTGARLLLLCNPHNPVGRVWSRQELAELELATGNDKGALAAFERAARASYELKEAHTAAALYQRCADLEDLDSPGGALRRSRLLRRAAFALTRQPTTAMTRAQLPRARDLWQLGADLLDQAWERPCEESVQERADAYEQLGEILWSGTELQEAGGHFATAARLYAEVGRSEDQARVTAHVARIHAILIQEDPATHVPLARQGVAQVRALLAHPRWEGNPALEDVGKVEQYLDSLEPAGARSAG